MKVWTAILAGVLLAALPSLGDAAVEDAGVLVSQNYTKFTRRVFPANTLIVCTTNRNEYEWFRINKFETLLLNFESGNNTMKTALRLGTPSILTALVAEVEFSYAMYCKYLPKALTTAGTALAGYKVVTTKMAYKTVEYYAVRINDTERATIKKGWNYLLNVVKNRFPANKPSNYEKMVVEKTAAGEIYVGAIQDYTYQRMDDRTLAYHLSHLH